MSSSLARLLFALSSVAAWQLPPPPAGGRASRSIRMDEERREKLSQLFGAQAADKLAPRTKREAADAQEIAMLQEGIQTLDFGATTRVLVFVGLLERVVVLERGTLRVEPRLGVEHLGVGGDERRAHLRERGGVVFGAGGPVGFDHGEVLPPVARRGEHGGGAALHELVRDAQRLERDDGGVQNLAPAQRVEALGGARPGSMPPKATSLLEEGVVLPPMKIVEAGQPCFDELEQRLTASPWPTTTTPARATRRATWCCTSLATGRWAGCAAS